MRGLCSSEYAAVSALEHDAERRHLEDLQCLDATLCPGGPGVSTQALQLRIHFLFTGIKLKDQLLTITGRDVRWLMAG